MRLRRRENQGGKHPGFGPKTEEGTVQKKKKTQRIKGRSK